MASPTVPAAGPAPRILVAEHDRVAAEAMCAQLALHGYDICGSVNDGASAVATALVQQPDLVIINAVLPGAVGGIAAAGEINRRLGTPLLFLSAYSDPETVRQAIGARPYGYLTKPFNIHELHAQIEVALARGRADRHASAALQWYAATLRGVADSVIVTDAAARLRYLNPAAEALIGWRLGEVAGKDADTVVTLQDAGGVRLPSPFQRMLQGINGALQDGMHLMPRRGEPLPVEDSAAPIYDVEGKLLGAVLVLRDIRQRAAAEQQLRRSEERFRNAFDLAPGGMALAAPDGRFIQVNTALCRMLQRSAASLTGSRLDELAVPDAKTARPLTSLAAGMTSGQFEQCLRAGDRRVWALVSVSVLRPDDGGGLLYQLQDITERKRAERKLARLAHFDPLTGLPNRVAISEEIERQLALARRHQRRLAVVFLDLDYFKHVNDSLGHEAGDRLLRVIGKRLRAAVRESDMVGRLGGDEFVVVLPEIEDLGDLPKVAGKMQEACLKPVYLQGQELRVGISLGASLYPDDADDVRSLLRYADSAMYQAKSEGRGNFQFYRQDMTRSIERRLRLGASVRQALERGEFELYYQPIMRLDTLRPCAVEALLRWHHPELGLLGPDEFLPVAEELGLAAALGRWVFHAACRAAAAWGAADGAPLQLAVNISPSQFRERALVDVIAHALTEAGLPPQRLCLEITEQLMLSDTEHNRQVLVALKTLGLKVSIDDFGTGYSSLSYLGRLDADEMTIDRSLTEGIGADGADNQHTAIVRAAVAMAHSLQLSVVSEGVESAQQHMLLRTLGCDYGQGYWYLPPSTDGQLQAWLAQFSGTPAPAGGNGPAPSA